MSDSIETLPWPALSLQEPEIPWDALHQFAEAASRSGLVRQRLIQELDHILTARFNGDPDADENLCDMAIPAVFALAAEKFDETGRHEAAVALLQALYKAGEHNDEFLLELIPKAARPLGPVVLEPALSLLDQHGTEMECFFHLMSLLDVSRQADGELRGRVIEICRTLLKDRRHHYEQWTPLGCPAWTLAVLGDRDSLPVLRKIYKRSGSGDILEAIEHLEGKDTYRGSMERDENQPVDRWLPSEVQHVRAYLAKETENEPEPDLCEAPFDDPEGNEKDEALVLEFCASPAHAALPEKVRAEAGFIVKCFLDYLRNHIGAHLHEMGFDDVREIVLDIFPRKVFAERSFFVQAPAALACFVEWLGATAKVSNAAELAEVIRASGPELLERSEDPRFWGIAKSFAKQAKAAGVDMHDREAFTRFTIAHNEAANAKRLAPAPETPPEFASAVIRRSEPRVGRNDPCPCGSERKYKKCCGKRK